MTPDQAAATYEARIARLSISRSFGVLTRGAFEERMESIDWAAHVVVYFDIDGLKQANEAHGKAGVNLRIRTALAERAADIGQWFSGDEFVAVVPATDAAGFAQRVQAELHAQGLSATILIQTDSHDIDLAEDRMKGLKDKARNTIYVI